MTETGCTIQVACAVDNTIQLRNETSSLDGSVIMPSFFPPTHFHKYPLFSLRPLPMRIDGPASSPCLSTFCEDPHPAKSIPLRLPGTLRFRSERRVQHHRRLPEATLPPTPQRTYRMPLPQAPAVRILRRARA